MNSPQQLDKTAKKDSGSLKVDIYNEYIAGARKKDLSRKYGLSNSTISRIVENGPFRKEDSSPKRSPMFKQQNSRHLDSISVCSNDDLVSLGSNQYSPVVKITDEKAQSTSIEDQPAASPSKDESERPTKKSTITRGSMKRQLSLSNAKCISGRLISNSDIMKIRTEFEQNCKDLTKPSAKEVIAELNRRMRLSSGLNNDLKAKCSLSYCSLDDDDVICLFDCLKIAPILTRLNLKGNLFGNQGATHILEFLKFQLNYLKAFEIHERCNDNYLGILEISDCEYITDLQLLANIRMYSDVLSHFNAQSFLYNIYVNMGSNKSFDSDLLTNFWKEVMDKTPQKNDILRVLTIFGDGNSVQFEFCSKFFVNKFVDLGILSRITPKHHELIQSKSDLGNIDVLGGDDIQYSNNKPTRRRSKSLDCKDLKISINFERTISSKSVGKNETFHVEEIENATLSNNLKIVVDSPNLEPFVNLIEDSGAVCQLDKDDTEKGSVKAEDKVELLHPPPRSVASVLFRDSTTNEYTNDDTKSKFQIFDTCDSKNSSQRSIHEEEDKPTVSKGYKTTDLTSTGSFRTIQSSEKLIKPDLNIAIPSIQDSPQTSKLKGIIRRRLSINSDRCISGRPITYKELCRFRQTLFKFCSKSNQQVHPKIEAELSRRITQTSTEGWTKAKLNFSNCGLEDSDISYLVESLVEVPIFAKIELKGNFVTDTGAMYILRLLRGQLKMVKSIPLDSRLLSNFLGILDLMETNSLIDTKLMSEINAHVDFFCRCNAQSFIRRAYNEFGSEVMNEESVCNIYKEVIGKTPRTMDIRESLRSQGSDSNNVSYADLERLLLSKLEETSLITPLTTRQLKFLDVPNSPKMINHASVSPKNRSRSKSFSEKKENENVLVVDEPKLSNSFNKKLQKAFPTLSTKSLSTGSDSSSGSSSRNLSPKIIVPLPDRKRSHSFYSVTSDDETFYPKFDEFDDSAGKKKFNFLSIRFLSNSQSRGDSPIGIENRSGSPTPSKIKTMVRRFSLSVDKSVSGRPITSKELISLKGIFVKRCAENNVSIPLKVESEFRRRIQLCCGSDVETKSKLNFRSCGLEDVHLIHLVEALAEAPVIAKLDISGNNITDNGVTYILRLLRGQLKLLKTVSPEKRLQANFLCFLDIADSEGQFQDALLEEMRMCLSVLKNHNARTYIRRVYIDHGAPERILATVLGEMWKEILGKNAKSVDLSDTVNSYGNGDSMSYDDCELFFIRKLEESGILQPVSNRDEVVSPPIGTPRSTKSVQKSGDVSNRSIDSEVNRFSSRSLSSMSGMSYDAPSPKPQVKRKSGHMLEQTSVLVPSPLTSKVQVAEQVLPPKLDISNDSADQVNVKSNESATSIMRGFIKRRFSSTIEGCVGGRMISIAEFTNFKNAYFNKFIIAFVPILSKVELEFQRRLQFSGGIDGKCKPKLNFSNCELQDFHVKWLCEVIAEFPFMSKLDLRFNSLTNKSLEYILNVLQEQVKSIRTLNARHRSNMNFLSHVDLSDGKSWDPNLMSEITILSDILLRTNAELFIYRKYVELGLPKMLSRSNLHLLCKHSISKDMKAATISRYFEKRKEDSIPIEEAVPIALDLLEELQILKPLSQKQLALVEKQTDLLNDSYPRRKRSTTLNLSDLSLSTDCGSSNSSETGPNVSLSGESNTTNSTPPRITRRGIQRADSIPFGKMISDSLEASNFLKRQLNQSELVRFQNSVSANSNNPLLLGAITSEIGRLLNLIKKESFAIPYLNLSSCGLHDEDMRCLIHALAGELFFVHLNISDNCLSNKSLKWVLNLLNEQLAVVNEFDGDLPISMNFLSNVESHGNSITDPILVNDLQTRTDVLKHLNASIAIRKLYFSMNSPLSIDKAKYSQMYSFFFGKLPIEDEIQADFTSCDGENQISYQACEQLLLDKLLKTQFLPALASWQSDIVAKFRVKLRNGKALNIFLRDMRMEQPNSNFHSDSENSPDELSFAIPKRKGSFSFLFGNQNENSPLRPRDRRHSLSPSNMIDESPSTMKSVSSPARPSFIKRRLSTNLAVRAINGRPVTSAELVRIMNSIDYNFSFRNIPIPNKIESELKRRLQDSSGPDSDSVKSKFNFSNGMLEDLHIQFVVEALLLDPVITKVELRGNNLTDKSVSMILNILKHQVRLANGVPMDSRLHHNYLSTVDFGEFHGFEQAAIDECKLFCEILNYCNVQSYIRRTYKSLNLPDLDINLEQFSSLWKEVIGKSIKKIEILECKQFNEGSEVFDYGVCESLLINKLQEIGTMKRLTDHQRQLKNGMIT